MEKGIVKRKSLMLRMQFLMKASLESGCVVLLGKGVIEVD